MPSQTDYILIGLGMLAAVITASYVPSLVSASSTMSISNINTRNQLSLENMNGIDINALKICKQNGFL